MSAVPNKRVLPAECIEQAAHWYSLMQSGDQRDEDSDAFDDWLLKADNAAAYQRIVSMWEQVDVAELKPARKTLETVLADQQSQRSKTRQRTLGAVTSAFVLTAGFLSGLQAVPGESLWSGYLTSGRMFADYSTGVGEHQVVLLSDGTRVNLNTFSAIDIGYTSTQRTIHLLQGEIWIDVAKDSSRPLVVLSEQGSVRALGTQFSVREYTDYTRVDVTESRVEVCPLNGQSDGAWCQQLKAGEMTQLDQNVVQPPEPANRRFTRDWNKQLLIVDNQPVVDVLDELRRHRLGYVRLDRRALSEYRVSGVFPLNDFAKSLEVLEGSLPIRVDRFTPMFTRVGVE